MNNARKINSVTRKIELTTKEINEARIAMCLAKTAILEQSYETVKNITEKDRYQLSNDLFEVTEEKNNAYIFILESGNMEAFKNYCNNGSVKVSQDKPILRIV